MIFVKRVRGNTVFRDIVHRNGTDLQFDTLLAWTDNGCVDGAVVVSLWRRDVILKATGHHRPAAVDDAKRLIAVIQCLYDNSETENVGQLLKADRLAFHFAPDRIGA